MCVGFGAGAAGFGCVWRRAHRGSAAARRPTAMGVVGQAAGSALGVQRQKVKKNKKKTTILSISNIIISTTITVIIIVITATVIITIFITINVDTVIISSLVLV